jgi:hypothetical protein
MLLSKALRKAPILVLVMLALASFFVPALAATYTVTVQTDSASYTGSVPIEISGTVSPAPGPNTAVVITVTNPNGTAVDYSDNAVNPTTGAYNHNVTAGGTSNWVAGTYKVNATWAGDGTTAIMTTTFKYTLASTLSVTTTAASCSPISFAVGATSQCSAIVSGATPDISGQTMVYPGEQITFTQTGGTGSVAFPPTGATCILEGAVCSITVNGTSAGSVTIKASYPGDTENTASSGTASTTVTPGTTTTSTSATSSSTTSTSSSSSTTSSSSSSTSILSSSGSTTSTSSSTSKGLGSLTYVVVAIVLIILVAVGLMMWRRRVASDYDKKPTTEK